MIIQIIILLLKEASSSIISSEVEKETSGANFDKRATSFKNDCLNAHNLARSNHGIAPLEWDSDLAKGAKSYSATLKVMKHSGKVGVGENLYWTSTGTHSGICSDATNAWMKEELVFKSQTKAQQSVFNSQTGHYTQVIWKNTKAIGCGSANGYVTCNYKPPGNLYGQYQINLQ